MANQTDTDGKTEIRYIPASKRSAATQTPANGTDSPNTEPGKTGKKGVPKKPIILGVVLLLVVAISRCGASSNSGTTDTSASTSANASSVAESSSSSSVTKKSIEPTESEAAKKLKTASLSASTSVLEYSDKDIDPLTLVTCSDSSIAVSLEDGQALDLATLGEQTVNYKLSLDGETRTCPVTFEVRDTKPPFISFIAKQVEMEEGGEYDPLTNVDSVTDPVDGDLPYLSESDGSEPGYTVTGEYDTNRPGNYEFTVLATDNHGNTTEGKFILTITEKPQEEAVVTSSEPAQQSTTRSNEREYVLNINTGKFHNPGCSEVRRMKEENRQYVTSTKADLIAQGYSPCGKCNPS